MMAEKIAVFCFQFAGWEYQPPAGDQTSTRRKLSGFAVVWVVGWWTYVWDSYGRVDVSHWVLVERFGDLEERELTVSFCHSAVFE